MIQIEVERRRRRLTQQQLADKVGMSQTLYSLLERGRLVPTDRELTSLARVLAVPADTLLAPVGEQVSA